jgi:hypothetical protein
VLAQVQRTQVVAVELGVPPRGGFAKGESEQGSQPDEAKRYDQN